MIREFYMIRHKPSGGFLPQRAKGYTSSEPQITGVPRLFTTAGGAKRALSWWLRGAFWVTHNATFGYEGFEDDNEEWHEQAMPNRKAEDMEVTKVLLKS